MSTKVRVETRPDGMVAIKEATGADTSRLIREADILDRARHPGLVTRLEFTTDVATAARLVTRHVGTRSLAGSAARPIDQIAGLTAAVATIAADLHALDLTHGAIVASHVLLDEAGRPVLCSPSGTGRPGDDVAAIGSLLAELVGHPDGDPIPDRRLFPSRSRPRRRGYLRRALLNVADQASADDPARRPTARSLAATIHQLVPDAALETGRDRAGEARVTDAGDRGARASDLDRPRTVVASQGRSGRPARPAVMALAAAIGLLLLTAGLRPSRPGSSSASGAAPTTSATVTATGQTCPALGPGTAVDVDGDGCLEGAEATDGVVTVDDRRWAVGQPDDLVALGDWDCDGRSTAALLRPDTGEVFVFDGWAGPGDELEATPVTTVDGATAIEARARPDTSCHRMAIRAHDGQVHPVEVPERR
jgi:hypothetical protein